MSSRKLTEMQESVYSYFKTNRSQNNYFLTLG